MEGLPKQADSNLELVELGRRVVSMVALCSCYGQGWGAGGPSLNDGSTQDGQRCRMGEG